MGAMICSREGCESPMCDRYSNLHGYICDECFRELVRSGPMTDICDFMISTKPDDTTAESRARYAAVFK